MQTTSFGFSRRVAPGSTSLTLIDQLKQRHEGGWTHLSDLYGPLIYHWSRKSGLSPDDSADIVQEVFRSVAMSIGRFRKATSTDSFRGWLRTITRNKILDHLRAYTHRAKSVGGTDAHIQFLAVADQRIRAKRDSSMSESREPFLEVALDCVHGHFSNRTWRAFWLSIWDQLTSREIGDELGMSAAAVRLAKSRIIRRLRENLNDRNSGAIHTTDQ